MIRRRKVKRVRHGIGEGDKKSHKNSVGKLQGKGTVRRLTH
jgi:hypothetical protein